MTEFEKGYVAGAIDGDGYISLSEIKRPNRIYYSTHVGVTNTRILMLQYIKDITKIGKIGPSGKKNERSKMCYKWRISTLEMKPFLDEVKEYLIAKRRQAYLILEYLETTNHQRIKNPVDTDTDILRELIFEEMQQLNRRGNK